MKPAPFEYRRVTDLPEALEHLQENGDDAKLIAGGQSLVPMMNLRLARPEMLIDINDVPLDAIELLDDQIRVEAMVRQRTLEFDPVVKRELPVLWEATRQIAHPAIRNRGTVGGSLAHADPTAELGTVTMALDATVEVQSQAGARAIPAGDFQVGPFFPAIEPEEIVTAVTFPRWPDARRGVFLELAERSGDFALAAVAVVLDVVDGRASSPRIVLAGGGGGPQRAEEAEQALEGALLDAGPWEDIAHQAVRDVELGSDAHASGEFKRGLLRELVLRAGHRIAMAGR